MLVSNDAGRDHPAEEKPASWPVGCRCATRILPNRATPGSNNCADTSDHLQHQPGHGDSAERERTLDSKESPRIVKNLRRPLVGHCLWRHPSMSGLHFRANDSNHRAASDYTGSHHFGLQQVTVAATDAAHGR